MSKLLIILSNYDDSDDIISRIVNEDSKAGELVKNWNVNVVLHIQEEGGVLNDLLYDKSTYPDNALPCEITAIYNISVIY